MPQVRLKFLHVVVCLLALSALPAAAQPSDLFISEYIEGSSNNKAVEIYNGTAAPIDLGAGGYSIQMFFNGNPLPTLTINLTGTVAAGDVFVLAQSAANATILALADQTNGSGWFNGDDAVVLRKGSTIIDSIGQAGNDPGTEWGTGVVSTADNTLRRKASICSGDVDAADPFNPATEWDGFAVDTFSGLGSHSTSCVTNQPVTVTCGAPLQLVAGTSGSRNVSALDADGIVTTMSIAPVSGITFTGFTAATMIGGAATGTVNVSAATPAGTHSAIVTAGNNDAPAPQTGTCTLTVNVIGPREIFEIQGSGPASPLAGQIVQTVDNIVTAIAFDEATDTPNGFFIQTPAGRADASEQTSNGILVFTGAAPAVSVGDQVDVVGTVTEFFNMTEITNPTVTVDSSNNALPAAVLFTMIGPGVFVPSHDQPWPANELERFEGMLVRVENGRVSAPTDRFGDTPIVADSTRAFREPGMEYPGQGGYTTIWDGNPEIFDLNVDAAGLTDAPLAGGTIIDVAEGPLAFAFSDYQIWPTTLSYTQPAMPRPVRARSPGEFTVASQNLLRFFDSDRMNGPDDGAANAAEYPDKLVKASLHIRTVLNSPDVLVVEEVENLGVVQALAAQIAADDPSVVYSAHLLEGNDVGGIDTGFLVRNTVSVTSVTQLNPAKIFSFPGSAPDELHDRPPLVLAGEYIGNGAPFAITVVGIHNRSLSTIETSPRVRQKRLEQANDIAAFVQEIQSAEPQRRIILTGDFNAFQFSDGFVDSMGIITGNLDPNGALLPGQDIVEPNLIDQVAELPAAERYSFIFEGSAQVLDHTLTTQNLTPYLRGLQFARGNADAPASFRTDPTTPIGLSDHDAEVLFVMSDHDADGLPDDVDGCPQSVTTFVTIGACTTTVPEQLSANGCSLSDALAAMAGVSFNHGMFVSQATHWLNQLRQTGAIDNRQRSEIHRCVAAANAPQ